MNSVPKSATSLHFSIDDLPPPKRAEAVHIFFERRVTLFRLEPLPDHPIRAELTRRIMPGLGIVTGMLGGLSLHLTRDSHLEGDDVFFCVNLAGGGTVRRRGEETECDGAVVVRPQEAGAILGSPTEMGVVGLRLPHAALAPLVPNFDDVMLRMVPHASPAVKLLKQYLPPPTESELLEVPDLGRLYATHIQDLVALAIGATRDAAHVAKDRGVRAARLRAIKGDIAANLDGGRLTVTALAARHGVTPRYVHKLFESEGVTYSEFVLRQRLTRAHRMLSDPRFADQAISTLAYDVGFSDLSYFNRAFRRRYGATPSDVRRRRD
jgi:AraC-like DNA-binding protein